MSTTPYFPFYPADYLADTRHLTTEQHGAYLLLLMTAWPLGGRLPNDPKKLARIAGVSPRRWHLVADEVLEMFEADGDEIVSRRMEREYKKAVSKSAKRSASGKRGARAKALKNNNTAQAIAKQTGKHLPEPEPIGTSVPMKEAREARSLPASIEGFSEAWTAWPHGQGRNCGEANACRAWIASLRDGADGQDMLRAVKAYAATEPECCLRFDKFIRDGVWREWLPADQVQTDWRGELRLWQAHGDADPKMWNRRVGGPNPGQPGCLAPAEVLAEFGYLPGKHELRVVA